MMGELHIQLIFISNESLRNQEHVEPVMECKQFQEKNMNLAIKKYEEEPRTVTREDKINSWQCLFGTRYWYLASKI